MKFAQFQSTYKPLPTDVYERTGQELEAKYFRNREQSSLLRQALANTKVEDRNIGILAKATTDVENMLEQVNGKWHYASNTLYNARERLTGDEVLSASIEDYAKAQATKTEMQKRFEEGKIDQDALSAFYINEKRYNNKSIQKTADGQIINRWSTPTPTNKTDIQKKVLDIVQQLTLHKDSLAVGATKDGTPVYELYKNNPNLEGYITKYTATGVDDEKIAAAVKDWINTTPEVKQYMNYVNDAKVFDNLTIKDADGKYLTDENGEFVQKDLTAKDFRDLGIPVMDNWWNQSNTMLLPGANGTLQKIKINDLSPNFKESPMYKELREEGLNDQQALQQIYKQTLTNLQTDQIVNFGRQFGFKEIDTETFKNERYWFDLEKDYQFKLKNGIFGVVPNVSPMFGDSSFSFDSNTQHLKELNDLLQSIDTTTSEGKLKYARIQNDIRDLTQNENILRFSYSETPDGEILVNSLYKELLNSLPNDVDKKLFNNNKSAVIKYITGQSDELGFYDFSRFKNKYQRYKHGASSFIDKLTSAPLTTRNTFGKVLDLAGTALHATAEPNYTVSAARYKYTKAVERAIQKGEIPISFPTISFTDNNMAIAPIMKEIGTNILQRGASWNIIGGKQGEPMILNDLFNDTKTGVNPNLYDAYAELPDTDNGYGKVVIRFVPKKEDTPKLEKDSYIIEPNIEVKDDYFREIAGLAAKASMSPRIIDWANRTISQSILHKYFEPIKTALTLNYRVGDTTEYRDLGIKNLWDVPINLEKGLFGNFVIDFTTNKPVLWQADQYGNKVKQVDMNFNDIDSIENYISTVMTQ